MTEDRTLGATLPQWMRIALPADIAEPNRLS